MKNALPMTLIIIALLFGSMALGKLILNPSKPLSTQLFSEDRQEEEAAEKKGPAAPDFTLPSIYPDDSTLSLVNFSDKYVLLNFWASWCTPCIAEMPTLFSLAKENPERLALIALSIDSKKEKASTFFTSLIEKHDAKDAANIYAAWDQRAQISQNRFGTFQVPESYLISPEGRIIKKFSGVIEEDSINEINALIAP